MSQSNHEWPPLYMLRANGFCSSYFFINSKLSSNAQFLTWHAMPDTLHIADLFPDCVATACMRIGHSTGELYPQELALIPKAIDKRRCEFAAGRACAREALGAIGYAPMPILQAASRAPLWPDGILGTISHSHTWAGAAVTRADQLAGIGLDIETVGRVSMNIARKVLTGAESALFQSLREEDQKALSRPSFQRQRGGV